MNTLFQKPSQLFLASFLILAGQIFAQAPLDSFNLNCNHRINWSLTGLDLTTQLVPNGPNLPPATVQNWTIDDVSVGILPFLNHKFDQLGEKIVCANYTMPSGATCKTCQAIRVFGSTDGCLDFALLNPGAACSTVFEPVCGCDGITYGNFCPAINYHGNSRWWLGMCGMVGDCQSLNVDFLTEISGTKVKFTDKTTFPNGTPAGWFWTFDGQQTATGSNPEFDFLNAGDHKVCVTVTATKPGTTAVCVAGFCQIITVGLPPCVDSSLININAVCATIYEPVCGCDGKTYGNGCIATNFGGVLTYSPGECGHQCMDNSWIDFSKDCNFTNPVCGCNGATFQNACIALYYNGVTSWTVGACDVLGAKNPENQLAVQLFPNPVLQKMTAVFGENSSRTISVFDATGRLFFEEKSGEMEVEIDLTELPSGLFFVKIADNGHVLSKKLIKN